MKVLFFFFFFWVGKGIDRARDFTREQEVSKRH